MNDDDVFRRFFGTSHHTRTDTFAFHDDFQRVFNEMDQMMSRFNFGHFNIIDGNIKYFKALVFIKTIFYEDYILGFK